ncbi:hypothetical protein POTOM_018698 [Populus tomentosa]|uniref:Uncharacterized protein n=1 Tax=Populus tomentosa TaxID=118781 RepID=A0A8X7ZU63_POPTO|nr:hypothetical protein POTOM_018698 [Populus tomentosa]
MVMMTRQAPPPDVTEAKNDGKEIAVESLEKVVEDGEGEFRNGVKIMERSPITCWRAEESDWLSRSGLERIGDMVEIGLWYGKIERDLRPTVKQVNLMMDGAIVTPPPN